VLLEPRFWGKLFILPQKPLMVCGEALEFHDCLMGTRLNPHLLLIPPKAPSNLSRSSPQGAPDGIFLSLFPGPVKFPSLTYLEKLSSPYPHISTVALQEKAAQCGGPPEEVTPQLLHNQRKPAGQEGSSEQSRDTNEASNV
jgi:hypothetical protein